LAIAGHAGPAARALPGNGRHQGDGLEVHIPLGKLDVFMRLVEPRAERPWADGGLLNSFAVDGGMLVAGDGKETYQATANVMPLAELAARLNPAGPFFAGCVDVERHRGHVAVFAETTPAYLDIRLRRRSARRRQDEDGPRGTPQPLLYMEVTPAEQQ
jgi:hypothetical protein